MTGAQVRQARLLLGWTVGKLSRLSQLPLTAIERFERDGHMSQPSRGTFVKNRLGALQDVFRVAGVEFTNGEEPKIKLREVKL